MEKPKIIKTELGKISSERIIQLKERHGTKVGKIANIELSKDIIFKFFFYVFGIATRRDQLANNLHWKTFEWLQGETGIAFSKKKQILILVERGVDLSGIASKCDLIEFDLYNLEKIPLFFDKAMPIVRENIKKRLGTEALFKILLLGGTFVVGGFAIKGIKDTINEMQKKTE